MNAFRVMGVLDMIMKMKLPCKRKRGTIKTFTYGCDEDRHAGGGLGRIKRRGQGKWKMMKLIKKWFGILAGRGQEVSEH